MAKVGITERGDAGLDLSWLDKLNAGKVDAAIIITKDPEKLLGINIPDNVIIHCTITGLADTYWEPNSPRIGLSLEAYRELIKRYGGDRVVLRIDPVIPYDPWFRYLAILRHRNGRVRVSFLDMYNHVRERHVKETGRPFSLWNGMHAPLEYRLKVLNEMKKTGDIEVCGEPGISCTGCVSVKDMEVFGIESSGNLKRQREYCPCLAEKVELLSNKHPCKNNCLYCYWKD